MRYFLLAGLLALASPIAAQTNSKAASRAIMREGVALYQLERASWISTDLLRASHFPVQQITGTFSYVAGDSVRTLVEVGLHRPVAQTCGSATF